MGPSDKADKKTKIWPIALVGLLLIAGFIVWDLGRHERVAKFVATSSDIPGHGIPVASTAEFNAYQRVKTAMTRSSSTGDIKMTVVWNSPEFFNALATAEGAQAGDITRHKTLYHDYAEKFDYNSDFIFTVVLESPSTNLMGYPMKGKALLRNDKGDKVLPWQWREGLQSTARHLEGVLIFPKRNEAGVLLIGHLLGEHLPGESPPQFIELVLKGISGGPDTVFRWPTPEAVERGEKQ